MNTILFKPIHTSATRKPGWSYVVHDVTHTECRPYKWQHISLPNPACHYVLPLIHVRCVLVVELEHTECRPYKWQHISLFGGDFQIRPVITCYLSFMYGVCLLWSSSTQDHTLRKSTRVSHGDTILLSPFGQYLSFPIWTSPSQYPDLDYALIDTRIYTKYSETSTYTHPPTNTWKCNARVPNSSTCTITIQHMQRHSYI